MANVVSDEEMTTMNGASKKVSCQRLSKIMPTLPARKRLMEDMKSPSNCQFHTVASNLTLLHVVSKVKNQLEFLLFTIFLLNSNLPCLLFSRGRVFRRRPTARFEVAFVFRITIEVGTNRALLYFRSGDVIRAFEKFSCCQDHG
mmetsp:Transcript_16820/g.22559  ORF Transcript_16820/g.22559 Transcript_16820/m.22559 type:complete len:144 (+) Transcript_16820:1142-1573(+)